HSVWYLCCSLSLALIVFFSCSRPHRVLHSFPTRRSSDLGRFVNAHVPYAQHPVGPRARQKPCVCGKGHAGHARLKPREGGEAHRSEEHTSELQSLAYLVCRLLLEKKKNKQKQHNIIYVPT